VILFLWN